MKRRPKKRAANRKRLSASMIRRSLARVERERDGLIDDCLKLHGTLTRTCGDLSRVNERLNRFANAAVIVELRPQSENGPYRREIYSVVLQMDFSQIRDHIRYASRHRFLNADNEAMRLAVDVEKKVYEFLKGKFAEMLLVPPPFGATDRM